MSIIGRCPSCGCKLYERSIGLVCKNWKCKHFWKLGVGWACNPITREWEYHSLEEKIRKQEERIRKKYGKYINVPDSDKIGVDFVVIIILNLISWM